MPKTTLPLAASKLAQQNLVSSSRVDIILTYRDAFDANAAAGKSVANELVVGAGWKSARVEQTTNVTQENALGWYDILDTIEHNVSGNTFTVGKLMMRWGMLCNIGVATWGADTLISPLLDAYIFDPKELQQGDDFGYVRLEQLHVQTNAIDFTSGQTVMENVTFRPNKIRRVNNTIPQRVIDQVQALYPGMAEGREGFSDSFTYDSVL